MLTNFTGNLYGPVEVGHIFIISGKTVDGASVFDVNLASAKYEEADIPLHLSVHFHSESIVRNSLIDQEWGEEEVDENIMASPNPIVAGWDFKVLIMTTDDKFHIAVNDYPYCTYAYRLPIENIHTLLINGDMQKIFQVDHRRIFPSPWPILHEDIKRGPELSFDIPKQFYPGHVSVIHAIPSGNHNGNFIIKLMKGASKREMFHFSARFNQRAVIVNSHLSDSLEWRKDEEKYGFPFVIDQLFKLGIAITDSAFVVAVDGEILCRYTYRAEGSFIEALTGIKISTLNGLQLEVQGIDHMNLGNVDCEGFETYTSPDVFIN